MDIKKYARESPVVDAVRLTPENLTQVKEWCGGIDWSCPSMGPWATGIQFGNEYVTHEAADGDWVLKDEHGRFFSMSAAEFKEQYAEIE